MEQGQETEQGTEKEQEMEKRTGNVTIAGDGKGAMENRNRRR
jgi:hypothetical protein